MTRHSYAVSDESRLIKARKIIACLEHVNGHLHDKEVLDLGCGSGLIAAEVSARAKCLTAIDITGDAFSDALGPYGAREPRFRFVVADGTRLPFRNGCFDIVICNQVFEHVPDQSKLVSEIHRVLKPDGCCYVATGNKLWPIEPHTGLPFLSYLPEPIADKYIARFTSYHGYDVYLPTYWAFRRILSSRFDTVIDLTALIVKHPREFCLTGEIPKPVGHVLGIIPLRILKIFLPFSPGWVAIAVKRLHEVNTYTLQQVGTVFADKLGPQLDESADGSAGA